MKNLFLIFSILTVLMISSCADSKDFVINGETVTVEPYGWANYEAHKNDSVIYEPVFGNIVWSIVLVEFIFPTVYFTGWSIMEPVALKNAKVKNDTSLTVTP